MTTLADFDPPGLPGALMPIHALLAGPDDAAGPFAHVEEVAHGLRIHAGSRYGATRPLAALAGSMLLIAAASLILPLLRGGPDPTAPFRIGLGLLLACGGVLLLAVASSSARPITDVDLALGQVRVYVRGFLGWPRLLATKGFDAVTGLRISRPLGPRSLSHLIIEVVDGEHIIVASGSETSLGPLHRRLARDLTPGQSAVRYDPNAPLSPFEAALLPA